VRADGSSGLSRAALAGREVPGGFRRERLRFLYLYFHVKLLPSLPYPQWVDTGIDTLLG